MTANAVFVQELADACQRPVEISAELEATSLGAAFTAGLAVGTWSSLDEVAAVAQPRLTVEPSGPDRRGRWKEALSHSRRWIPDFSALDF
jgi:glycerol kinase